MLDERASAEASGPADAAGPRMVSVPKVAARFGIPCHTLQRLVHEGKIEAVVVSRRTLVVLSSIERFVAALPRVGR